VRAKRDGGVSGPYISDERCSAIVPAVPMYCAAVEAGEKGQQCQQARPLLCSSQYRSIVPDPIRKGAI